MTSRERFIKTLRFEPTDKPFVKAVGGWQETAERWRKEGWDGRPLHEIFGTDLVLNTGVYYGPAPRFEHKVVEEDETTRVYINHEGILINDPVLQRVSEDCFWLSIADSDIGLWAGGIAAERGLAVRVTEPDASPLGVQGPRAPDVVADLFGDWVRDLKYFWHRQTDLDGILQNVITYMSRGTASSSR